MPKPRRKPTDFGRAVGQYIGLLMERKIRKLLTTYNLIAHEKWANSYGLTHEIDYVVGTRRKPIVLIDSKYIKYQKHAREKANEIASMLISVKNAHPSVKLLIAILAGNFTHGSKRILSDRDIQVLHIPFEILAHNMRKHELIIDWTEDDKMTAEKTWEIYDKLSEEEVDRVANDFFDATNIPERLQELIQGIVT
ncbi:MAG: hypothetical protein ACETVP_00895 [Candidatus Bathyarchaeia archaeon]